MNSGRLACLWQYSRSIREDPQKELDYCSVVYSMYKGGTKKCFFVLVWLTGSMPRGYGPPNTPGTTGSSCSTGFLSRVSNLYTEKSSKMTITKELSGK